MCMHAGSISITLNQPSVQVVHEGESSKARDAILRKKALFDVNFLAMPAVLADATKSANTHSLDSCT